MVLPCSRCKGAAVVAGLLNGGHLMTPTLLKRSEEEALAMAQTVVKPTTSEMLRYLFRLNATDGTAGKANVIGYRVGGKTGTAEKVVNGRYAKGQIVEFLHRRLPDGQAEISHPGHAGRAEADA